MTSKMATQNLSSYVIMIMQRLKTRMIWYNIKSKIIMVKILKEMLDYHYYEKYAKHAKLL